MEEQELITARTRRGICTPSAMHSFKYEINNVKGKAVSLQVWSDPEGSRKLRFPDYMTTAQDGGKVKVKQSRYRPGVAQRVPGN
jgi:hypothetical protein